MDRQSLYADDVVIETPDQGIESPDGQSLPPEGACE
jgi:hypothetical protein